jgi:hypothetical protein
LSDVRAAWERIVKHLRAEARWRDGRVVDELSSYQFSEPLNTESGATPSLKLEANLSNCIVSPGKSGSPVDFDFDFGDVFQNVEAMAHLGERAIEQIENEMAQRASIGGGHRANQMLLEHASGDGSEVSLGVSRHPLPHEMRRFDALNGRAPTLLEHPLRHSEDVCLRALERVMAGSCLRWSDPREPGGTHDVDMFLPGSDTPPVRAEFTELTSEMGEEWGRWPRSGKARAVKGESQRLRYSWHASMNMNDTLFWPEWADLVRDSKGRKRRSAEIDEILLEHLLWTERQMGTFEGALSLANQRISADLKPGGRLLVFPYFWAEEVPEGTPGVLTVSYDGYWVDYSTIGSPKAVEPINLMVARKAEQDQAGALPGEKWLVMYLDPTYAIAVIRGMEKLLKRPPAWQDFASSIDRRHFQEVWLVWERLPKGEGAAEPESYLNVVRFTTRGTRFVICK